MTFISRRALVLRSLPALAWLAAAPARAGLGEPQSSIEADSVRMSARHALARTPQYTVHELKMADGSLLRQYVAGNGRVFAIRWNTLSKPDLSSLLGSAFADYRSAAQMAARQGGIQRHFRHDASDLVLQSDGHLHVYSGYAYRRSLLPPGLIPQSIGLG
jgi:hypothetical protein